jgi:hypothetical protein
MFFRVYFVVALVHTIDITKRRFNMYANLKLHEIEKLRKLEKELGVVLIAYREERGYVPSQGKYTSTSP